MTKVVHISSTKFCLKPLGSNFGNFGHFGSFYSTCIIKNLFVSVNMFFFERGVFLVLATNIFPFIFSQFVNGFAHGRCLRQTLQKYTVRHVGFDSSSKFAQMTCLISGLNFFYGCFMLQKVRPDRSTQQNLKRN